MYFLAVAKSIGGITMDSTGHKQAPEVVLQQHGYQVDQHRRFISTTLADGRRVTVPVDLVQVRYTGNNPL